MRLARLHACMSHCQYQAIREEVDASSLCRRAGTYKIPTVNDIPLDLRVTLLRDAPCAQTPLVHSSKAVGEPPLFLGASVFFALKARACCAPPGAARAHAAPQQGRLLASWLIRRDQLRLHCEARLKGPCFTIAMLQCNACTSHTHDMQSNAPRILGEMKSTCSHFKPLPLIYCAALPAHEARWTVVCAGGGVCGARGGQPAGLVPHGHARHVRAPAHGLRGRAHRALCAHGRRLHGQLLSARMPHSPVRCPSGAVWVVGRLACQHLARPALREHEGCLAIVAVGHDAIGGALFGIGNPIPSACHYHRLL